MNKKPLLILVFLVLAFLYSFNCYSQTIIHGAVKDIKTNKPLSYCAIAIKGTARGCITNEDGVFKISVDSANDTLVFSYMGYKPRNIAANNVLHQSEIFLQNKNIQLKEVVISADDEYLFNIMEQCRKKLLYVQPHKAKVYFELETDSENQPVELLQCYYNGELKGTSIEALLIKNGRVALAEIDNNYFVSLSTSLAMSKFSLINANNYLPFIPFQYNRRDLKKRYSLKEGSVDDDNVFHIEFVPLDNDKRYYKGEVWIDKETFSILKITLNIENSYTHPFLPLCPGDSLSDVCLEITQTFNKAGDQYLLNHIDFNYRLKYIAIESLRLQPEKIKSKMIKTKGVMYIYDYENPFPLPYFNYDSNEGDYRKISFIPYNENFWKSGNGLMITEKQKQKLDFFQKNGFVLNFNQKNIAENTFFQNNNIFWSAKKRVSLRPSFKEKNALSKAAVNQTIPSDLYNLKVQIFLDMNIIGDSIEHYSATVFDVSQTFFSLPEEVYTNCFINIYFDICEIERRKMEHTFSLYSYNLSQIDSVYQQTVRETDKKTKAYLKEVHLGKSTRGLSKWSEYVYRETGIDNFKLINWER